MTLEIYPSLVYKSASGNYRPISYLRRHDEQLLPLSHNGMRFTCVSEALMSVSETELLNSSETIELLNERDSKKRGVKRRNDDEGGNYSKNKKVGHVFSNETEFQIAPVRFLKQKQVESHDDYLDNFKSFKSAVIEVLSDSRYQHLVEMLDECQHVSAISQHLHNLRAQLGKDDELIDELIACWPMTLGLAYEAEHADRFGNNVMALQFETELAHFILQNGSKKVWREINSNIINYMRAHYDALADLDETLKAQMIQYKVCKAEDFRYKNGRDVFMQLLRRKSGVMTNITEAATLHLVFFNYCHLFKPELDFANQSEKTQIINERNKKHRQMRPNEMGQMFSQVTRGRERAESVYRTREFGIMDEYAIDDDYSNWHRYDFTPHKYRSTANLSSSIVQRFRISHIPFIAGPSGTCADCLEGLHFLNPKMTKDDKRQYLTMLAAAEVGMGHHSFHEVLLTALKDGLYLELLSDEESLPVWQRLDYKKSYHALLGGAFKNKRALHAFKLKYPQFLLNDALSYDNLHQESIDAVKQIQTKALNSIAYHALDEGPRWHSAHRINELNIDKINLARFKQLSKKNISSLSAELTPLSAQEIQFVDSLLRQPVTLTHYTKALPNILNSGRMYSNSQLNKKFTSFNDSSDGDVDELGNGGFVFFRFELEHDTSKSSRFGKYQICLDGRESQLLDSGWVSLYEMLAPGTASVVGELTFEGERIRKKVSSFGYKASGTFEFKYKHDSEKHLEPFDVFATLFYGRDILPGIAYSMVRELRRIGGRYQKERLEALSLSEINDTLSQLFRVEAKIPDRVLLSDERVKVFAPQRLEKAILAADKDEIEALVSLGVDVFMPMTDGMDVFDMIGQKDSLTDDDVAIFCFLLNHAKATLDNTSFDKRIRELHNKMSDQSVTHLVNILSEFIKKPKPQPFFASFLQRPLQLFGSHQQEPIEAHVEALEAYFPSPWE
jgi:hypothetical protein